MNRACNFNYQNPTYSFIPEQGQSMDDNNINNTYMTVDIPYRLNGDQFCAVRVDKEWWHADDNSSIDWRVLGVENDRRVGNYVICGDPTRNPLYMHVCVYTHYNPEKLDAIQSKQNQVDHIHSDPTDNRIQSLRIATRHQNIAARRPPKKRSREEEGNGSVFKGVSRKKNTDRWVCEYMCKAHMTKRMRCAAMPSAVDAAQLYNRIVSHFQPTFGYLNDTPGMIFPGRNPSEFLRKRNALLLSLKKRNSIDNQTYTLSLLEPLPSAPLPLPTHSLHLLEWVKKSQNGKVARTSIRLNYQKEVSRIVKVRLDELQKNKIYNAAILVSDTKTGEVLAYVGNGPTQGSFGSANDMIQAARSSGSILKPFLYAGLLESASITPRTLIPDIPTQYAGFSPKNYDQGYDGAVPAEEALARSLNIPAVRMLKDYGIPLFHKKLVDIGLSTLSFPPSHYGLSLILGGAEVKLWDLVHAYRAVGSRLLESKEINNCSSLHLELDQEPEKQTYSFSKSVSWSMVEAMALVNRPEERASWELFGGQQKIAWKTGTSYGFRDAWAVGINPKFTVGVWVGNASGEGRPGITGLNAAAPLLFDVFNALPSSQWFSAPSSELVEIELCTHSGMRASKNCGSRTEREIPIEALKTAACTYCYIEHLDKTGQFRVNTNCYPQAEMLHQSRFELPPLQAWFYRQKTAFYKEKAPWHPNCNNQTETQAIQLIYPRNHSSIFIPRELNGVQENVVLKAAHFRRDAQIHWHLNDKYLGITQNFHHMEIQVPEGKYLLTLIDELGLEHAQWIEIRER